MSWKLFGDSSGVSDGPNGFDDKFRIEKIVNARVREEDASVKKAVTEMNAAKKISDRKEKEAATMAAVKKAVTEMNAAKKISDRKEKEAATMAAEKKDFSEAFVKFLRGMLGTPSSEDETFHYRCPAPVNKTSEVDHPPSASKWAIVCLTRGTGSNKHLSKRTKNLANYLMKTSPKHVENFQIDFVIFHEGDVVQKQQKTITSEVAGVSVNFNVIFKDISQLFVKTEPLSMINNAPGYTAMCRFWTFKVWGVLDKMGYTNYWRVDDDIYIKLPTGKEPKTGLIREFEDGGYSYAYKKYAGDAHGWTQVTLPSFAARWARECSDSVTLKCGGDKKEVSDVDEICIDHSNFYNNNGAGKVGFWLRDDVKSFLDSAEHMKGVEKFRWGDSTIQALALKMLLDLEEDFLFMEDSLLLQTHNKHKAIPVPEQKACFGGCPSEDDEEEEDKEKKEDKEEKDGKKV